MNKDKRSLLEELKWTIVGLSSAMIVLWLLFYLYMNISIRNYTMRNMEQVSTSVISELEQSFMELEELSFSVSENKEIANFLTIEDRLKFHTKAGQVKKEFNRMINRNMLADHLLLYNNKGEYYRFYGNISNTAAKKIYYSLRKEEEKQQIKFNFEGVNYIGYVASVYYRNENLGKIVMLIEENDIYRLFQEAGGLEDMTIGLAADNRILVANDEHMVGLKINDLKQTTKYQLHKEIGFTPFQLIVVYEKANKNMVYLFLVAIIITSLLLLLIVELFLQFWRNKFFKPIQKIIYEVEKYDGEIGVKLEGMDIDYFDSLVNGINDMLYRIEQKEAELFQTTFRLQNAEIMKQKALVISLKKQINAHFTVNILNIIKALSNEGNNEKSGLMCDGLSYLLRYANGGEAPVNAMEEFFILNKYLSIMEIRYPGRFTAEVDMEDFLEGIKLPRMLIQPLVENSIIHGLKDLDEQDPTAARRGEQEEKYGRIHIFCEEREQELRFIVEDNGCGMEERQLEHLQNEIDSVRSEDEIEVEGLSHVALKNIQRRIISYFGKDYGVTVTSKKGVGTKVVLTIPRM